jgi:disulfide bond formation protein DsbB
MDKFPLDRVRWPFIGMLASAAMLGAAHAFERFLYLAPCPLCYNQRQAFWVAAIVALAAVFANWRGASPRILYLLNILLGVVFAVGALIAAYHALVEWKILPAPATCAISGGGSDLAGDLWAQLGKPQAVPSCAEPKWHFLGLSMAAWNVLISSGLAGLSFVAAARPMRIDTANESASAAGTEPA